MQRRPTAELLDTDSGTPAEVAGSIADLRMINRWFGGVAAGDITSSPESSALKAN